MRLHGAARTVTPIPASQWDEMRDAKVKQLLVQEATLTDEMLDRLLGESATCAEDWNVSINLEWMRAYGRAVAREAVNVDEAFRIGFAAAKPVGVPSIRTFINVGTGYVLDGVGALSAFNVKREAGETDDSYRKRLLAKLDQLELPI
jgi:hypothetical protein